MIVLAQSYMTTGVTRGSRCPYSKIVCPELDTAYAETWMRGAKYEALGVLPANRSNSHWDMWISTESAARKFATNGAREDWKREPHSPAPHFLQPDLPVKISRERGSDYFDSQQCANCATERSFQRRSQVPSANFKSLVRGCSPRGFRRRLVVSMSLEGIPSRSEHCPSSTPGKAVGSPLF